MLAGYTAVLSSPAFLYLDEKPGRLEDRAIANRLSYFLWNTAPDAELQALAKRGDLHRPKVLRQQTEDLRRTGSARAGVFDATGRLLAVARRAITIWHAPGGIVEQSTEQIWQAASIGSGFRHPETGQPAVRHLW